MIELHDDTLLMLTGEDRSIRENLRDALPALAYICPVFAGTVRAYLNRQTFGHRCPFEFEDSLWADTLRILEQATPPGYRFVIGSRYGDERGWIGWVRLA